MDYHVCGIVEKRGLHDQQDTYCGRDANTLCYDCGTSLCSAHSARCELCGETFCGPCLTFHQSEHAKPAQSDRPTESPRKKTA